jgi:O-acetyl-ADP-ribose deacetylase (regulator of RNase III)
MMNQPPDDLMEPAGIPLDLNEYRSAILLDEPFERPEPASAAESDRARIVQDLLAHLLSEHKSQHNNLDINETPSSYHEMRRMLRALITVRPPGPLPDRFNDGLDRLLQREALERGITDTADLPVIAQAFPESSYGAADKCILWRGSIVELRCDAIVNAANSYLLGCFQPFHACIDNVIHCAAGPRVREDCNTIVHLQDGVEGTGWAKATRGYNLPAKYIFHTVGPIIKGNEKRVSSQQEQHLIACYRSCLDLALRMSSVKSVAFCCISTGVFGFPQEPAALIALKTVEQWLSHHPGVIDAVVFNVFTGTDHEIYKSLLEGW